MARMGRRWRFDLAALTLLGVGAALWCLPGLLHGAFFGSYDLVLHFGLGAGLISGVHNAASGDTARQGATWAVLNWRAVRSGTLPLWDPYVVLGLPEAANLQSAPASLPSLLSYLLPLRYAYTGAVVAKLLVGGAGCYVAARVLSLSRPSALLAGIVGEVGGPMAAWAGWPQTGVGEWTGWLIAAVLLVAWRPSWRRITLLAVVVAFAAAGGFPELLVVLAIAVAVLVAVVCWPPAKRPAGGRPCRRALAALAAASALGGLLSAPVWLPALPVLGRSVSLGRRPPPLPSGEPLLFLDPFYWGRPVASSLWFGPSNYYETAAFVGPLVVALAVVALACRFRDRRVLALGAAAAAVFLLGWAPGFIAAVERSVPGVGSVAFGRGLLVCCDLLGLLAAVGLEEIRSSSRRGVRLAGLLAAAGLAALLAIALAPSSLPASARAERDGGALLAAFPAAALLVLVALRRPLRSRRQSGLAASALVGLEAASLLLAGAGQATWASTFLPGDARISSAVRQAKGGLVALGGQHPPTRAVHLGLLADLNAAYGLRELAGYDAMMPRSLERSWAAASPAPDLARAEVAGDVTSFVPEVTTPEQARALGVSAVLEPLRPPVRLVGGAAAAVGAALGAAGVSRSATTGILDALEWLSEQPSLLERYPLSRPGALAAYLEAAAGSRLSLEPPTAHVAEAAALAVPKLRRDARLEASLVACFTRKLPSGTVVAAHLGEEVLLRFSGLGGAAFVSPASGSVVSPLRYLSDASAEVTVSARRGAWLRLGVDAEPGWSAKADGRTLAVRSSPGGAELEAEVPAGTSRLILSYWPEGLSAGLLLSLAGLVVVAGVPVARLAHRRARAPRGANGRSTPPPEGRELSVSTPAGSLR